MNHSNHRILNRVVILVVATVVMCLLVSCSSEEKVEPTATPEPVTEVTLTISGSGGTVRILSVVQAAFEAATPGYSLDILSGTGTGGGVQGVTEGTFDVAAMARPPKDSELEATPGLQFVDLGRSGQGIFTHPDVGVTNLTTDQAIAVFWGEISDWSELGGPELTIILFVRDEGDSSTAALRGAVFGEEPFLDSARVLTSQGDMIAAVERTPGAIGFGTWPAVVAEGADVVATALDGVAPNDPTYPITGVVGIGYLEERQEDVEPLVDWLLSEEGQSALAEVGVIITQ